MSQAPQRLVFFISLSRDTVLINRIKLKCASKYVSSLKVVSYFQVTLKYFHLNELYLKLSPAFFLTTSFSHQQCTHIPKYLRKQFPSTFLISVWSILVIHQAHNLSIIWGSFLSSLTSYIFNLSYLPWEDSLDSLLYLQFPCILLSMQHF